MSTHSDYMGDSKEISMSDRECIFRSLENCESLAGLDRKQVQRLMEEFKVEKTIEQIKSEYPPL